MGASQRASDRLPVTYKSLVYGIGKEYFLTWSGHSVSVFTDSDEFGRANYLLDESRDTPEALIEDMVRIHERVAERDSRIGQLLYKMERRLESIEAHLRLMDALQS